MLLLSLLLLLLVVLLLFLLLLSIVGVAVFIVVITSTISIKPEWPTGLRGEHLYGCVSEGDGAEKENQK